ncbi:MAG: GMC family oxidoreductase [Rhodothermales bacterium]|nr:GMC family oxidoreductase [Rhodothermales bacterium]
MDRRPALSSPGSVSGHYDAVVIGSGFGGSVSALRLAEKGYSVLVVEKGRRLRAEDFPKTNWNLRRWLWMPQLGWRGLFKMTFFRHVTVLSGVGVGGGSLVYAATLPVPRADFFEAPAWAHLADWQRELAPHYATAQRMLGAVEHPLNTAPDKVLRAVAGDLGREEHFTRNPVGIYFGQPGETTPDPYFGGAGPARTACTFCGACMTGCRHGAKNSLDTNYLYLAERLGARIQADTEVTAVRPMPDGGYRVEATERRGWLRRRRHVFTADRVIFAGGVLGTTDLLLKMKEDPRGLPNLSDRLGQQIRTNSESLIGIVTAQDEVDYSEGVAITSILHTDADSHVEPVRYGRGSGFFRLLTLPHGPGDTFFQRLAGMVRAVLRRPGQWFKTFFVWDFARRSFILLYMRTAEGTLTLRRRRRPWRLFRPALASEVSGGLAPRAFMPEATAIAERVAEKVDGVTMGMATENALGTPTTAHILGGCCMGATPAEGVIDAQHRVFGYDGLYVIDGSAVSANPGVNPSLTITALAERAMAHIPAKAPDEAPGATALRYPDTADAPEYRDTEPLEH